MLFYNLRTCVNELWMHARFQIIYSQNHNPNSNTVFPRIVSMESILFKLKQSCLKLLNLCHVVVCLTFENSDLIKLLQIASD